MRQSGFYSAALSDVGRQRENNEDAYALPAARDSQEIDARGYRYTLPDDVAHKGVLFLAADGVGGSEAGQQASLAVVRAVVTAYYAGPVSRHDLALEQAVSRANEEVYAEAVSADMTGSTTLVGLLLLKERGFVVNIGDSRAYCLRRDSIEQLTQDHSLREQLLHSGEIAPEEGATIPEHIITRSVGRDPAVTPDIFEVTVEPGDQFLLCTDGLTRHVNDEELLAITTRAQTPQQAVEALVALANERGGKDNITALLIRTRPNLPVNFWYTLVRVLALLILLAGLAWMVWRVTQPSVDGSEYRSEPLRWAQVEDLQGEVKSLWMITERC